MKKFLHLLALSCLSLLSTPMLGSNKLIQENRVWEYYTSTRNENYIEQFCFDGIETLYGKSYNVWKIIRKTVFPNNQDSNPLETLLNSKIALLREEDGKVFMLMDNLEYRTYDAQTHELSQVLSECDGQESILYDFNVTENESFTSVVNVLWMDDAYGSIPILTECNVSEVSSISLSNTEVKEFQVTSIVMVDLIRSINGKQEISSIIDNKEESITLNVNGNTDANTPVQSTVSYAEILGNTGRGKMTELFPTEPIFLTSGMFDRVTSYLYSVYDTDGTIIYGTPSGISSPEYKTVSRDNQIYDLYGREISNPLPGSIYIRNGKKIVGK